MKRNSRRARGLILVFFCLLLLPACSDNTPKIMFEESRARREANFGNELLLEDITQTVENGRSMMVLHWRAFLKPREDYDVFIHAMDKQGNILFQFDHKLLDGAGATTSEWYQGQVVKDAFSTSPPPEYAGGKYTFRMGVYKVGSPTALEIKRSDYEKPSDNHRSVAILVPDVECR